MRVSILLFVFVSLLVGCTMLKKDTLSNRQQNTTKFDRNLKETVNERSSNRLVIKDSLNSNAILTIWPQGTFTFSPETGFMGEATQVQMAFKVQQVKQSNTQEERTATGQVNLTEKADTTANKSSAESSSFKWQPGYFLIVLLVLAVIGLLLYLVKR